jgi:hypothetical protein
MTLNRVRRFSASSRRRYAGSLGAKTMLRQVGAYTAIRSYGCMKYMYAPCGFTHSSWELTQEGAFIMNTHNT